MTTKEQAEAAMERAAQNGSIMAQEQGAMNALAQAYREHVDRATYDEAVSKAAKLEAANKEALEKVAQLKTENQLLASRADAASKEAGSLRTALRVILRELMVAT